LQAGGRRFDPGTLHRFRADPSRAQNDLVADPKVIRSALAQYGSLMTDLTRRNPRLGLAPVRDLPPPVRRDHFGVTFLPLHFD
jgi:hypothetical protein